MGALIEAVQLPTSSALLSLFGASERWLLQTSGDDYELCFSVPEARCEEAMAVLARTGGGATCIGSVVEGAGVRLVDAQGELVQLPRAGWNHFGA